MGITPEHRADSPYHQRCPMPAHAGFLRRRSTGRGNPLRDDSSARGGGSPWCHGIVATDDVELPIETPTKICDNPCHHAGPGTYRWSPLGSALSVFGDGPGRCGPRGRRPPGSPPRCRQGWPYRIRPETINAHGRMSKLALRVLLDGMFSGAIIRATRGK